MQLDQSFCVLLASSSDLENVNVNCHTVSVMHLIWWSFTCCATQTLHLLLSYRIKKRDLLTGG